MKVFEWLSEQPDGIVVVGEDLSIKEVAGVFLSHPRLRDLYVVSAQGDILGHIRHRRLAQLLLTEHLPFQSSHQLMERVFGGTAGEIMERDFVSAHPDEELDNILHQMLEYRVDDMPVVDSANRVIGTIKLTDVMRASLEGDL